MQQDYSTLKYPCKDFTGLVCHYCGLQADAIDHVIPRSVLSNLKKIGDTDTINALLARHKILLVPACHECNGMLGAKYYHSLEERKQAVKALLRRHYAKLLETPDWSNKELSKLSYRMKQYVMTGMAERDTLQKRLDF